MTGEWFESLLLTFRTRMFRHVERREDSNC